jgi:cytochrome c oxidase subunit III
MVKISNFKRKNWYQLILREVNLATAIIDKYPIKSSKQNELIANVSMLVTLISFTMLFATLFMGYAVSRASNDIWPPMGMDKVSLLLPGISTGIILLSSWSYWLFEKSHVRNSQKAKFYLALTGLLGFGFLILQVLLWSGLKENGYYVANGIYPSILYAFTWTHAAHLVMGLIAVLYIVIKYFSPRVENLDLKIKNVGIFWHFLDLVWLIIFITIFVF